MVGFIGIEFYEFDLIGFFGSFEEIGKLVSFFGFDIEVL